MDKNVLENNRLQAKRLVEKLRSRNFGADFFETKEEMLEYLKNNLEKGSSIAVGGSMTLFETGVIDYLTGNSDYNFIDRYHTDNIEGVHHQAFTVDNFIMSTNALTIDGILYNVDGNGTRLAPLIYGPKKVYVVCGMNKVVLNLEEAKARVEHIAAPANNVRLNRPNPCTQIGQCAHCNKDETICNSYVVTRRSAFKDRVHVLLINENLGY